MQLEKDLERRGLREMIRKVLIANLLILLTVLYVGAEGPADNDIAVQKQLLVLEMKLEEAIQKIDNKESKFLKEHLEVCADIENRLKNAREKKRGYRLSKKVKNKLAEKLKLEYQTINMVQQINNLNREAKRKAFEAEVEEVFAKHDVYTNSTSN